MGQPYGREWPGSRRLGAEGTPQSGCPEVSAAPRASADQYDVAASTERAPRLEQRVRYAAMGTPDPSPPSSCGFRSGSSIGTPFTHIAPQARQNDASASGRVTHARCPHRSHSLRSSSENQASSSRFVSGTPMKVRDDPRSRYGPFGLSGRLVRPGRTLSACVHVHRQPDRMLPVARNVRASSSPAMAAIRSCATSSSKAFSRSLTIGSFA
jgi:hypothetical protein